jgi:hypothetical protein
MRKPLLLTVVCLLLVSGFSSAKAQAVRRRSNASTRNAASAPKVRAVNMAIDVREAQLLGSFNGRVWTDALKTMPLVKKGDTFRLYSLSGPVGTGVVSEVVPPEYPCDDIVGVNFSALPEGEDDLIGVNGSWNAQPRLPKIQNTGQQEYRAVVSDYLKGVGIRNPKIIIFQLLRVDLDGDGTQEVLIAANNEEKPGIFMGKGDFSLVLLRRFARGRAQTIPIISEVELKDHAEPFQTAMWHHKETVAGILDIDGDGVMEVITTYQSVYDGGKSVYDLKGRKPRQVIGWGCSGGH